jgi:maltooligosyltrehalose trehalohydrolase
VPDPQAEETFLRSKLQWEELGEDSHAEMLDWYRRLIVLRRQESSLTRGELQDVGVSFDETQRWLRMTRGPIEVAFNAGKSDVTLPVANSYETILASSQEIACGADSLRLPARSVAVLRNREVAKIP